MEGKNNFFFFFCDLNETFIFLFIFSSEACQQMKYELVVQRRDEHILSYYVPKTLKV